MSRPAGQKAAAVRYTLLGSVLLLMTLPVVLAPRPVSGYLSRTRDYGHQSLVAADSLGASMFVSEDLGKAALDVQEQDLDKLSYLPLALKNCCGYCVPARKRFAFGVSDNPVEDYDVSLLNAGWYVSFGFRGDPPSDLGLEFVQTIRLCQQNPWTYPPGRTCASDYTPSQETIENYATAHPGTLWLIGNEPDAPMQDCITPARYAQLYHDLYWIIKGADPSARVAIGGVVQATPLRLQYLDQILQKYQKYYGEMIPVDVWNVHGFILQELAGSWGCQIPCGLSAQQGMLYTTDDHDNMTIFKQQIVAFRQWMKDHGQRDKPLIVTEYGILFPDYLDYLLPRVRTFMLATFDYFVTATDPSIGYPADCDKLVQGWAWYSLDDDNFEGWNSHSHLFDPDTKQITELGTAYGNYVPPSQ